VGPTNTVAAHLIQHLLDGDGRNTTLTPKSLIDPVAEQRLLQLSSTGSACYSTACRSKGKTGRAGVRMFDKMI
jgi:hypothetical protein